MSRDFNPETLDLIAARLKVLAERTRLQLLNALRDGERTVSELVEETGTGQANVSKHLGLLHRERILGRRKEGLNVFYRIADPHVFELCEIVCASLESELDARRQALDATG